MRKLRWKKVNKQTTDLKMATIHIHFNRIAPTRKLSMCVMDITCIISYDNVIPVNSDNFYVEIH